LSSIKYDTHNSYALTTNVTTYFDGLNYINGPWDYSQNSKQVIRIMFDDHVVHEFMFSYDGNGSLCYAILEDPAKTIKVLESLKFKIENLSNLMS